MIKSKSGKKAAFIPFLVIGEPSLEFSAKIIDVLVEEGADSIELGVPYSDALADGPVIQSASESASKRVSLVDVLKFSKKVRAQYPELPLILFTYLNPILKMDLNRFADEASKSGITAVLVVDLPPEEAEDYLKIMKKARLKTVFLASPTTPQSRLSIIDAATTGFVYYVSRTGVTGEQTNLSNSLKQEVQNLKKVIKKPVAIGFGISTAEQAAAVSQIGDAVVVGSAFVRKASQPDAEQALTEIRKLAREISAAIA